HVVKGAHDAIPAAQDQRPLAGDVEGEVVATLGNVGDVPGNLPVAAEHMLELKLEQGLAVVAPGWQAPPVPVSRNPYVTQRVAHGGNPNLLNDHSIRSFFPIKCNALWRLECF